LNNLLDKLDKYKFGLLAAMGTYIFIFMYLQFQSFSQYVPYDPFFDGSFVEIPQDEIRLKPENIMVAENFSNDVKNMARDANDQREESFEEYYENASDEAVAEELKKLEQEMYNEAGGEKTRAEIREEVAARKLAAANESTSQNDPKQTTTGGTSYKGDVMVDWSLRGPHKNNAWYIRNPGYTAGIGAQGIVYVIIKVNQNGDVVSAVLDQERSRGTNSNMVEKAIKYAKMSRFEFSNEKTQTGWISYKFISQ